MGYEIIVAMLLGVLGGALNVLYEKYGPITKEDFVVTKALLANRMGTGVFAALLVFFGLAQAGVNPSSIDVVALAQAFAPADFAAFVGFGAPLLFSGYFGDDVVDVALANMKNKFSKKESPGDLE